MIRRQLVHMQTETYTIDRGQALMKFYQQYGEQRNFLPQRMHDHKEPILELIGAGISADSAFKIVLQGGLKLASEEQN